MSFPIFQIPLPIFLVAMLFFFFPVAVFFSIAQVFDIQGQWGLVFQKIRLLQYCIFILCFAISYGLLFKKKFGFYLFLFLSGVLICYNLWLIGTIAFGGSIFIGGVPIQYSHVFLSAGITFTFLALIFYFLRREIRAPYFSSEERGWRTSYRESHPIPYSIYNQANEKLGSGITANVSSGGALLILPDKSKIEQGTQVILNFKIESEDKVVVPIQVEAKIIRLFKSTKGDSLAGVSFLFPEKDKETQDTLASFLDRVFSPRFIVRQLANIIPLETSVAQEGTVYDISSEGLYIMSNSVLPTKTKVQVVWQASFLGTLKVTGTVRWSNSDGIYGKPKGYGIKMESIENHFKFHFWVLWQRIFSPTIR